MTYSTSGDYQARELKCENSYYKIGIARSKEKGNERTKKEGQGGSDTRRVRLCGGGVPCMKYTWHLVLHRLVRAAQRRSNDLSRPRIINRSQPSLPRKAIHEDTRWGEKRRSSRGCEGRALEYKKRKGRRARREFPCLGEGFFDALESEVRAR